MRYLGWTLKDRVECGGGVSKGEWLERAFWVKIIQLIFIRIYYVLVLCWMPFVCIRKVTIQLRLTDIQIAFS